MSQDSTKTCCAAGKPKADDYKAIGVELNLSPELRAYQVGNGNKNGVVLLYDIFGFDILQTRRFADCLAKAEFNVIMPDFFRGKPWSLENFPPKDYNDLKNWIEEFGSYSIVEKDLKLALAHLHRTGVSGKPGILGFCWGGKMSTSACHIADFSCGISIHGAMITPELCKDVRVPMMFLQAGDDPSLDAVKAAFVSKPLGDECVFYRFEAMSHGFAAARGDWSDDNVRKEILKAISMSTEFLNKHID